MKIELLLLLVIVVIQMTLRADEAVSTTITIERDPKNIAEFGQLVQDAAEKGTVRVKFPSGEWNWYSAVHMEIPQKKELAKWESKTNTFNKTALKQWIINNKVAAVQIYLGSDIDPKIYFIIEKILRDRKIPYWVIRQDPDTGARHAIIIYEANGAVRSIP